MARIWEMNTIETTSQQLMDAIGEQRRLRRREGSSVGASSSWRKDTKWSEYPEQDEDDAATAALGESFVEPPLSLNADGERNYHLVGTIFNIPLHNVSCGGGMGAAVSQTQQHQQQHYYTSSSSSTTAATIVPASNQSTPINLSPLTATSVCAMEKEYDRDTWRMYQRIKSARTVSTQPVQQHHHHHQHSNSMPHINFTTGADRYNNNNNHSVPTSVSPLNLVSYNHQDDGQYDDNNDDDDFDEIFEMDLDS